MDLHEYEAALADLETRLDRLKVLYEQWFQGLERLEPAIPRKDVDRRFYQMRKETVRNTALRFRFQQLIQRYTTYITYWGRVTRQIEEGTYRRDVMKMRQVRQDYRARLKGGAAYEIDIDVDQSEASVDPELEVESLDASDTERPTAERGVAPVSVPSSPPIPSAPATGVRPMLSPFAFGRPNTGSVGGSPPPAAPGPVATPVQSGAAPVARAAGAPATATFGRPSSQAPTTTFGKAQHEPKTADIPTTAFARPAVASGAGAPVRPPVSPLGGLGRPIAKPVSPPPQPVTPARVQPPAAAAAAAPAPARDVSEDQIRAVYDRYVDARRKNNERTDNVRYETLAKSLRDMVPKLREKHSGKAIDFEIVVKDGKVGIKPVPKG